MLDGEKNSLELAVGPWQRPLVLEFVVPPKGETYIISTSTFSGIWQIPCSLGDKEIAQVTAHNVQLFVSLHVHGECRAGRPWKGRDVLDPGRRREISEDVFTNL